MKKFLVILAISFLTTQINAQQNFKVTPLKPIPGSAIKFEWLTRNTSLQGKQDIEGTAYLLYSENKLPHALPIVLKKEGGIVTGTVKTNDSTKAVFFSFSKDDIIENNNDEGYYTILYDKSGKEISGGNVALATVFYSYGYMWGLKRNLDKATKFYEREFKGPEEREKNKGAYLFYLSQLKDDAGKDLFRTELAKTIDKKNISEALFLSVKNFYEYNLKDKETADKVMARIKEQFPNGSWRRNDSASRFTQPSTPGSGHPAMRKPLAICRTERGGGRVR